MSLHGQGKQRARQKQSFQWIGDRGGRACGRAHSRVAPHRAAQLPPVRWTEALAFKLQMRKGDLLALAAELELLCKDEGTTICNMEWGSTYHQDCPEQARR